MTRPAPTREQLIEEDVQNLRTLGYAQQLYREMGGFSNFAVSFSIISVLTGAILLYGYGLKFAGPIVNSVGWPVVSLFTLCVAASMAELASAYPTAGGLYFWAFRLGGRTWAWVTAWLNMIGQVTITAGINVAAAIYVIGAATRMLGVPADAAVPVFGTVTNWYFQLLVMVLLMVPQVLINVFGIKLTARLADLSVWWHIGGVAVIVALLTGFGAHHNSVGFLFSTATPVTPLEASSAEIGGRTIPALVIGEIRMPSALFALVPGLVEVYHAAPFALVFVLALLQAQWTYTGYDASAHVAEETVMARLNSAWGVFLSVAVSAVVGLVMLLALTWAIPGGDVAKTAADPYPVLYIVYANLATAFAHAIAIIIGVAMWLCGLTSITSMARMWYAFARDDGMPGARLLKQVSARYRTPVWAIVVTSVLAVLISVYAAAYSVITSISTITLYLAYGLPIYLNWRNRRHRAGEFTTPATAPWSLGRFGALINGVAILWVLFLALIFSLPPNELVLWTMLGLAAVLAVYWRGMRRRFRGPAAATVAMCLVALVVGGCSQTTNQPSTAPSPDPSARSGPIKPFTVAAAPQWRVGDTWIYEWDSAGRRGEKRLEVIETRQISGVAYHVVRSAELEHFYTRNLEWAGRARGGGFDVRMVPPYPWFTWPLEVGRQWIYRGVWEEREGKRSHTDAFAVLTAERIEVPAGSFDTLKVAREAGVQSDEYWYAPEVAHYVRWIGQRGDVRFEERLRAYRPVSATR